MQNNTRKDIMFELILKFETHVSRNFNFDFRRRPEFLTNEETIRLIKNPLPFTTVGHIRCY